MEFKNKILRACPSYDKIPKDVYRILLKNLENCICLDVVNHKEREVQNNTIYDGEIAIYDSDNHRKFSREQAVEDIETKIKDVGYDQWHSNWPIRKYHIFWNIDSYNIINMSNKFKKSDESFLILLEVRVQRYGIS